MNPEIVTRDFAQINAMVEGLRTRGLMTGRMEAGLAAGQARAQRLEAMAAAYVNAVHREMRV